MEIIISGRHMEITPAIRQYTEERANRLTKYYDMIREIEVILDGSADRQKRAEFIVGVEHNDRLVASHEGEDLYGCIDQAVHKAQHQITAHKDRFRNRKHSGS